MLHGSFVQLLSEQVKAILEWYGFELGPFNTEFACRGIIVEGIAVGWKVMPTSGIEMVEPCGSSNPDSSGKEIVVGMS